MATTWEKYRYLFGAHRRRRWSALVILGLVAGVIESVGAGLVLVLMRAISEPDTVRALPLIEQVADWRPNFTDKVLLSLTAALIAAFFVARSGLLVLQTYWCNRSALNAGAELAVRLWRGYAKAPYTFHLARNSSELIRNANDATIQVASFVFVALISVASQLLIVAGLLAVLLLATPVMTLAAGAVMTLAMVLLLRALQPRFSSLGDEHLAARQASLQSLQQELHGIREVLLTPRIDGLEQRFATERFRLSRAQYLQSTLTSIPRLLLETLLILGIVVLVLTLLLVNGSLEDALATLGLVVYVLMRIIPAVNTIVTQFNSFGYGRAAVDDVYNDLVTLAESEERSKHQPVKDYRFERSIELSDVTFVYPNTSAPALDRVTLEIAAGEAIGIVGRTGAGKSTLLDLVLGLLHPTAGEVKVDGEALEGDLSAWHAQLGVVSQSFYLIDDTIRRNVAFGLTDADIDDAAVAAALRLAQLESVVAALPAGVETMVGEHAVRLSGGQRQRLAIARALYRDPDVVVFDEGTSALDSATEREVIEAIERLHGRKTLIIVAHRLATVANCDRVALLDGGRLVDCRPLGELQRLYSLT